MRVSLDHYLTLPDPPGVRHELLRGRLIKASAPSLLHAAIQAEIARQLGDLTIRSFPHLIFGTHSEFLVDPETGQAPDVFLIDRQRQRGLERYRGAIKGAPDLAVEIISPSEAAEDVDEKVELYLAAGTRAVWLVWPKTRHVLIYYANGEVRKADLDEFLDAPDVLPGAKIPVASIFPEL